jgi:hypothetical protein
LSFTITLAARDELAVHETSSGSPAALPSSTTSRSKRQQLAQLERGCRAPP